MSKIHVLSASGINQFTVVVHTATPAGNNGAGIAWSVAVVNSGHANSILPVGSGPGQITQAELTGVEAGTTIEGVMQWQDDPAWNNAQRQANLDLYATALIADLLARYQRELKYFGFVRT